MAQLIHLATFLLLLGICFVLVIIDLRTHQIYNRLILPIPLLAWLYCGRPSLPPWTFRFLAVFAIYFTLYLLSRRSLGAGDVKLAATLACLTTSWVEVDQALMSTWLCAGVTLPIHRAIARKSGKGMRSHRIAFAPYLVLPAIWLLIRHI